MDSATPNPSAGRWSLGEIAARLGGRVTRDPHLRIDRVAAIDDVAADVLTFATDDRYLARAVVSNAAAVLTDESLGTSITTEKPLVLVSSTRLALAALLAELGPKRPQGPARDSSASVDPSAVLGEETVIGTIQAGAVIGSDGFGFAFLDGRLTKIPQIGIVRIGDDVEIGANTCVDRAQTGETSIGEGTKIDNLCQIGHNCRIGKHSVFAAFCGLAGSTIIGDYVQVGGGAVFKGHITVGSRATIVGQTEVWGDIAEGATVSGRPARPHRERMRRQVLLEKLPKLFARVELLEGRKRSSED